MHPQVLPRQAFELKNLQALLPAGIAISWRHLLKHQGPFQTRASSPVISPSRQALLAVRARAKERPLILCQTVWDPPLTPQKMFPLIRKGHPLVDKISARDPYLPVRWCVSGDLERRGWSDVSLDYDQHPLRTRWLNLKKSHLADAVMRSEEGRIMMQMQLFRDDCDHLGSLRPLDTVAFDQAFRNALPGTGRALVVATTRERLCWFQCDVLRVSGSRAPCLFAGREADNLGGLRRGFLLATDSWLRFRMMDPNLQLVHLDLNSDRARFRRYRLLPESEPGFRSPWPRAPKARLLLDQAWFTFERGSAGWVSQLGPTTAYQDATGDLLAHLRNQLHLERLRHVE